MVSRKTLVNAFLPATEVEDPALFAGREQQVRAVTDSLHVLGSVPLIYGHRGLGKSSLALQIARIAMGDVELLSYLGAQKLALEEEDRYITLVVTCTTATKDLDGLLQAMINAAEAVEIEATNGAKEKGQLVDRQTRKKLALKIFEVESTKNYQTEKARLTYQELNLEEKLVRITEILSRSYGQPVLYIIDELDRMGSTIGLASFLKAHSGEHLKFILVGIANNISELLEDHKSLERRLEPVHLPTMSQKELVQIVDQAEKYLARHGIPISFDRMSKRALASVASGFPWFVHVLGQSALLAVHDRGDKEVDRGDVAAAIVNLVNNKFAQHFADKYQIAVRDSYAREAVLRSLAEWIDQDIPTRDVYRIIRDRFDFQNPSGYKSQLCKEDYGDILYTPVFQAHGLVRFKNEMFKAYVRIRPSLFNELDREVREAYGKSQELNY